MLAAGVSRSWYYAAQAASQGGFSTKIHVRAEGRGKPMAILITAGQRHEQTVFVPLMETGAVKQVGRGRPRICPKRVVGDKGYSSTTICRYLCVNGHPYFRWPKELLYLENTVATDNLRRRGIGVVIPRRKNERHRGAFDRSAYRQRNVAERLVNRLKQFRRIATRYEKRGVY